MKIGWVSASPIARTGYGRETREIGYRLIDFGFDVTFIGTFGDVVIWGGVTEQETFLGKKATILVLTDSQSAPDVIGTYIRKFGFQALVGFMDCFGLEFMNKVEGAPVIGYIPIDGPYTAKMRDNVKNFYKVVAYSKFGYRELQKWYSPSKISYIPHGVDTEMFHPLSKMEYREARKWLAAEGENQTFAPPVPEDVGFLAVDMGANIGPRKCLPLLMRTWRKFVDNHKEDPPHLILQTNPYSPGRGYDLVAHRINLGLEKLIHFPRYDPIIYPVADEDLRKIYGASDVFVHNAVAEGFGLPLVEASACGVPSIGPDNSAQTETIEGHGWLVESVDSDVFIDYPVYVPTLQEYPVVNQRSLLEKLEEAYSDPKLRKRYGRKSRRFVLDNYSWDKIIPKWAELLNGVEEELELFEKVGDALRVPPAHQQVP